MKMDMELVKFINSDLTWNAVKKGHRTMRRPKRSEASGNKLRDSVVFDYEKSGVAILGHHFAEEVPIKKRILLLQTHHELPKGSEHASRAITEKAVLDLNDFSGIELLAAAACVEEHLTPGVELDPNGIKQDNNPMGSDNSSVQDNTFPVTQNLCDDAGDKSPVPSKAVRLHWDLNTVMDEWEKPCDIGVSNDEVTKEGVQVNIDVGYFGKKDDAETVTKSDVVDSFVNPVTCENVSTSTASVSLEETATKAESDDKQAVSEVVQGGCLSLKGDTVDKLTSEDHLSDCCGSNVSQDKVKSGYDSPVEDGELREPDTHTWEKEESEEMECVDYESDNMYEDNSDTIESVTNEIVDDHDHLHTVKESVSVQNNDVQQVDKADSQPVMLAEKDSISKTHRPERKKMSCVDKPISTLISTSCIHRSRSERDIGQPSYHGGQWVDSFSRNKHGPGGYTRPKAFRSGGSSSIDNNEAMNYNPRGVYRTESYGVHNGLSPSRDVNRDRSRVGLKRSSQDEYNNPNPFYSERKAPFFGPNFNRGRSQKQSRSRSRSGSPIAWHFQKKRNVDTKQQSPDCKPDTRFPFRKPNETEAGHVSQCVSRRFDDRNVISGQYRERRSSPVRSRAHQRQDLSGYVGKFKSNDHFGSRYPPNGNYSSVRDERRRFRYDDDESFKGYSRNKDDGFRYTRTENKCFRDSKNTSEEKGCRFTTNKMFNTGEGHFHKDS